MRKKSEGHRAPVVAAYLIAMVPPTAVIILWLRYGLNLAAGLASILGLFLTEIPLLTQALGRKMAPISDTDQDSEVTPRSSGRIPNARREASRARHNAPKRTLPQSIGASLVVVAITVGVAAIIRFIGNDESPQTNNGALAIVFGAHSNAPAPELVGLSMSNMQESIQGRWPISVVVNSGLPQLAYTYQSQCHNREVCQSQARQFADQIRRSRASSPGNNLLEAIELASRTLSAKPGKKILDIVDSGLQTNLPLDFRVLLNNEPQEIVRHLQQSDDIPNLQGIHVVLSGVGDTAAPQSPLTLPYRRELIAIWKAICTAGGASSIDLDESPLTALSITGLPPVPTVAIPAVPEAIPPKKSKVVLKDATLGFLPNTATLIAADAAEAQLRTIAAAMMLTRGQVTITGTTASVGSISAQLSLSEARAHAVALLLERLGIPRSRFLVRGVGVNDPSHIPDLDSDGNLLLKPAAANRNVIIELPSS